jgi:hypothetical protein
MNGRVASLGISADRRRGEDEIGGDAATPTTMPIRGRCERATFPWDERGSLFL